jgi:RNA polymerase sigma-70 factor, ECF subfamily
VTAALAVFAMLAPAADPPADRDAELVERHAGGDSEAFAEIYRRHAGTVYRRLTRILGPVAVREDLTQDVFLSLHRALPSFRGDAALGTLIQRIAINAAYDHLRRRKPTALDAAVLAELVAPLPSPEAQTQAREELVHVFACLAKLKPKKRIALLLRVVDGLSFEAIAELVDATPDAVAKRVQHGQRELDALLARSR